MKLGDLIRHRHNGRMGLIVGERPMTIHWREPHRKWEVMWSDLGRPSAQTTYERQERLTAVLVIDHRKIVRS